MQNINFVPAQAPTLSPLTHSARSADRPTLLRKAEEQFFRVRPSIEDQTISVAAL
jgi:hypothetical protein